MGSNLTDGALLSAMCAQHLYRLWKTVIICVHVRNMDVQTHIYLGSPLGRISSLLLLAGLPETSLVRPG